MEWGPHQCPRVKGSLQVNQLACAEEAVSDRRAKRPGEEWKDDRPVVRKHSPRRYHRGALRAFSPLSTQIGVFDFFLAFATSKNAF